MQLTSTDFEDGGELADKFSCNGEGARPLLTWSEIPPDTKTLAITLVDPDAPDGSFVHWIAINIPVDTLSIASGEIVGEELINSSGKSSYIAPCPPAGNHHYIFTLYALDAGRISASSSESFLLAVGPHIVSQAKLTGLYGKS
ncbi:MAG: YbhB/YbcL family Raf kinase inhibitor-like protein [Candidatus Berkelbacteria bacterium]